ncbi:polymorphic toxin type 44 domain-containing protein [Luteibacter aegosomaticola]|uniref:RHS repeat-associated core domain-containing protein n=1 Tax=Luteibacter aegosomaticola TaxID=2911538 RepID=UPI001FFBD69C|nr:RHS repeat-associated core domain-containing protein [Luteibacter aegosomaticola]UPG90271.1 polymorphic toxin type 44 domain-containing protein [Luteibacter aegosomaticola]
MLHDVSSKSRQCALAIAIHLAIFSGVSHAADEPAKPFPAFLDGHVVPASFEKPGATGYVHHEAGQLASDVRIAANEYCGLTPGCSLAGYTAHEVRGASGKNSAYSVLDIAITIDEPTGTRDVTITGGIALVRSCPVDAVLVGDSSAFLDNRDPASGRSPVACISPDEVPKTASMGVPEESGANQCPIGNSQTVGNPINPLTMSKIETAVDYMGPDSSGLAFARTYHSGAFSLDNKLSKVAARYPAGARIGARWRHTYDRAFVRRPYFSASGWAYGSALHLVREDGGETRFTKKGDTYVAEEGERGIVREDADGGWVYTKADLTAEHYDDKGRLRSRIDANGNTLTLHYDDINVGAGAKVKVLVRVSDRQGRELKLRYDRYGRIETVDTPDGRITYDYSGDLLEGLDADLVDVSYPDGRKVKYGYDEPAMGGSRNHKLTGIVGNDGKRFATFRYDSANRAISSSHGDNLELTEVIAHDAKRVDIRKPGRDNETWYPSYTDGVIRLGQREEFYRHQDVARGYDYVSAGLVSRNTDYLGVPTSYKYDTSRRLETERTEADGTAVAQTVKTTWHPLFDKPIRIDNGAQWTVFEYDLKGNLLKQREGGLADAANAGQGPWPAERITAFTYDTAGRILTVDGPLSGTSDTTRYQYRASDAPGCTPTVCSWRQGDLHTVTDPLGHVDTVLAYDAAGRPTSLTDANSVRTDRQFDAMGRPVEVAIRSRRDGVPSAEDIITRVTYNANGDIDTLTDADGATLTHRYNSAHRLIEQVDAIGNVRKIERNDQGQVGTDSFRRPDGTEDLSRKYTYDNRGLPAEIETPDSRIEYNFDPNGRFTGTSGYLPGPEYHHDDRGRVDRISEGYGSERGETILAYDGANRVRTIVDPKGLSTAYLRNGLGDLLWRRSPDTGDSSFENDANGQPLRETPADTRKIDRTYDALGRVATVSYSDGARTTYTYDVPASGCPAGADFAVGRLSTVTDRDGSTTFCYDFAGRVIQKIQVTRGVSLAVHYTYSKAGRLASMTYPDGRQVTYTRDAAGNVVAVDTRTPSSVAQSIASIVVNDALGRPVNWTAGARTLARTYDGTGVVTSVRDTRPGGLKLTVEYTNSNVDMITNGSVTSFIESDSQNRVTSAGSFDPSPDNPLGDLHTYKYDKTGNRLSWNTIPFTNRSFVYAADSHHLTTANKIARTYDANGNTTRIGDREFVYDASGRMSQAKVNGVVEMNYAYNSFGQQVARYIAGQITVSLHDEAGHWIGDYDGAGQPIRQTAWLGDIPLAAIDGDAIRDIQADHLGTPRVVIDRASDKAIWTWSVTSEAFGSAAPNEDPDKDGTKYVFDMRFPGQRYDAVTGLFQNGWRDYDPVSGRYIQSDPIGLSGGMSTYSYVGGNPFVGVDLMGLCNCQSITPPSPPGVDINKNIAGMLNLNALSNVTGGAGVALKYRVFYELVRNKGPYDYKQVDRSKYADYGNFHYGVVGRAAGIPSDLLLRAAGWAQTRSGNYQAENDGPLGRPPYGDDPADQEQISNGMWWYENCYRK